MEAFDEVSVVLFMSLNSWASLALADQHKPMHGAWYVWSFGESCVILQPVPGEPMAPDLPADSH